MMRKEEVRKLIKNYPPKVRALIDCFTCKCGFGRVTMIENISYDERLFYMQINLFLYHGCYRYFSLEPNIQQLNKSLERLVRLKTNSAARTKAKAFGIYDISALEAEIRGMTIETIDMCYVRTICDMFITVKISCDENGFVTFESVRTYE